MPEAPSQTDRMSKVSSPLEEDVLLLRKLTVTEALSEPFLLEFELLSENLEIQLSDVLGEALTFETELPSGDTRYYSGLVTEFSMTGTAGEFASYRAVCRPWLWFLTRTADCRIFQEMTAPDIIMDVFREFGFTDFEDKLSGEYRELRYCVQYRESAFRFVSRLMEDEGIYYYFKHEDGKHTLVLSDDYSSHEAVAGEVSIEFVPPEADADLMRERIFRVELCQRVRTGTTVVSSFDFEKPGANLEGTANEKRDHAQSEFEVYDYEGDYSEASDGDQYSTVRLQEFQTGHEQLKGEATARNLATGALFELAEHPRDSLNIEYLVVSAREVWTSEAFETGRGEGYSYQCLFLAMDAEEPFRAPRNTPRALVQGPQTATVVGPSGEEIWTDEYGRIKVQFHWDRYGENDENSSCWIRVSHPWGGGTFGGVQIPRIGEEVIVDFLEGDPDRPIVTGRVYNADNMPPYGLPDNQTQAGFKTRSSPGGSPDNFNELRFEDKIGEEEVYFHAEKNFNRVVENDDTLKVGFEDMDPGNRSGEVYNDETWVVGNNQKLSVGYEIADPGDREVKIKNNEKRTIGADQTQSIGENQTEEVKKNQDLTVGGDQTISIGGQSSGSRTLEVEKDRTTTIKTGDESLTVEMGNMTVAISMGDQTTSVDLGKSETEAMQSIELKVGGSSIKVDQTGVTIKGMMIKVEGTLKTEVKGAMTDVKGDAMLKLGGGVTMIG